MRQALGIYIHFLPQGIFRQSSGCLGDHPDWNGECLQKSRGPNVDKSVIVQGFVGQAEFWALSKAFIRNENP